VKTDHAEAVRKKRVFDDLPGARSEPRAHSTPPIARNAPIRAATSIMTAIPMYPP
jgi:hypothetical protein